MIVIRPLTSYTLNIYDSLYKCHMMTRWNNHQIDIIEIPIDNQEILVYISSNNNSIIKTKV